MSVESVARDSPAQCKQSARLFLQSSELGLPLPSPAGECVLPSFGSVGGGGGYTLTAGEGVWGLNSDEGTDTVVL